MGSILNTRHLQRTCKHCTKSTTVLRRSTLVMLTVELLTLLCLYKFYACTEFRLVRKLCSKARDLWFRIAQGYNILFLKFYINPRFLSFF
jgi:hypothetical protein